MARAKHRSKSVLAQTKKFSDSVQRQFEHERKFGASPFPKPGKKSKGK